MGNSNILWEPLWQIETKLQPAEIELMECPLLRRLSFIHHTGAAYINSNVAHSRLTHTLSVFSLIAYFCPDNYYLRVAALLHDIGHPPFSHWVEKIEGVNHHDLTKKYILSEEISSILLKHNFDPKKVIDYVEGVIPNPLRNKENLLHIDQLDNFNFLRSAHLDSKHSVPPSKILKYLSLRDNYIETNLEIGELLVDVAVLVNKWVCYKALSPNAILKEMVKRLVDNEVITVNELTGMIDSQVESLLLNNPLTKEEAHKLWFYPHKIRTEKYINQVIPKDGYIDEIQKLYLNLPLVDGKPVTETSEKAKLLVEDAQNLIGKYITYWAE